MLELLSPPARARARVCVVVCVFSARAVGCEIVEVGFETAWPLLTPFWCLCVMVTGKGFFCFLLRRL